MAAKVFPLAPLPPAPIAALQHLAELVASLWPMQAHCPKLMRSMPMRPLRWAGQPAARLQCLVLAPIAGLQHLAGLVASLWPMQACCPKLMRSGAHAPHRWDVLQHVQQRQPVACAAHAGLLPQADAIHAHASPPMGRAARCAPAMPGACDLPRLCALAVVLAPVAGLQHLAGLVASLWPMQACCDCAATPCRLTAKRY